jgi:hypothetical protein
MYVTFSLLLTVILEHYSSGSTVDICKNRYFVTGDDTPYVLVLNRALESIDSISYVGSDKRRIPKDEKPDVESSYLCNKGKVLHVIGSGSGMNRAWMFQISLEGPRSVSRVDLTSFFKSLRVAGVQEINIEGSVATPGGKVLLANRANLTTRKNHLIIADSNFWRMPSEPVVLEITLPDSLAHLGVSDLSLDPGGTTVWMTLTTEETSNALEDGKIGDSYLARANLQNVESNNHLSLEELINLGKALPPLKNQKIEGLAIEKKKRGAYTITLVSDNDDGTTGIFKIRVKQRRK